MGIRPGPYGVLRGVAISYKRGTPVARITSSSPRRTLPPRLSPPHLRPRPYLTQCIYSLFLKGQLPHETVNLIFELVLVNNKLTMFWGELIF